MLMKELDHYYFALFESAEKYEKWRRIVLLVVLILLSVSLYVTGKLLYALAACAVIIQTCSLFLDLESKKCRGLANDFHKYSMLVQVFNGVVDTHELARLKVKAGNRINRLFRNKVDDFVAVDSGSYTTNEKDPAKRLIAMIQENSYWNNNLYKFSYKSYMTKIAFVTGLVAIAALTLIPSLALDQDFTVLRLLFTVMSFSVIYEFIETTLRYKSSSEEMGVIDHKISRLDSFDSQELLDIFSKYHLIKSNTPPISKAIYEKNKEMLNHSWNTRASQS